VEICPVETELLHADKYDDDYNH